MAPKDPAGAARFEEEEELPEDLDMARLMVNMAKSQQGDGQGDGSPGILTKEYGG